ncbi:hypothetical protein J5N97_025859 [Dioscorea zingiberensis]|uniref:Inositol oxygenase n=1 Tax=Dioscorea zingiberensis TaxID=325984 RepID=A0A9D5C1C3_9LILI|nr:hypothetical protein J5N97_025859 [Dioscorea zingiberensis]
MGLGLDSSKVEIQFINRACTIISDEAWDLISEQPQPTGSSEDKGLEEAQKATKKQGKGIPSTSGPIRPRGRHRKQKPAEGITPMTIAPKRRTDLEDITQTLFLVKKMREEYGKLGMMEMSIWEACELLNEVVDESDPDLEEPQIQHLLQTADAIRKDYPQQDWLHLTALIHDLGKVLLHATFGQHPQWAVVGDTFPVGCAFHESNVHHKVISSKSLKLIKTAFVLLGHSLKRSCELKLQYFMGNPDFNNPKYNTKYGVYSQGCGLDNVLMSWGSDEYMFLV